MVLLVDIGNTNTKMKLDEKEEILSILTSEKYTPDIYEGVLPESFKVKIDGAVIASVVPKANISVITFIRNQYDVEPVIIKPSSRMNVVLPLVIQNELGADLISSMEGAVLLSPSFISIDCGTATTFSVVVNKNFMGVVIAPGIATSHRALLQSASLIHYVDLNGKFELLNQSTDECVRSGTLYGFAFMVDGFVDAITKKYKINPTVYITGGMSSYIIPLLRNKVVFNDELLFSGLKRLYLMNRKENDIQ